MNSLNDDQSFQIIVRLMVNDLAASARQMADQFGFRAEQADLTVRALPGDLTMLRMRRLNQVFELVQSNDSSLGHGPIDHVALNAVDVDSAVIAVLAKWGKLDPDISPDGAADIPEFWNAGTRFVFMQGPGTARIEFCHKIEDDACRVQKLKVNLAGHDHIGIHCTDVDQSRSFYEDLNFKVIGDFLIPTPDGDIPVCFLKRGDFCVELFSTPALRNGQIQYAETPLWNALILEDGQVSASKELIGPDGEIINIIPTPVNADFYMNSGGA